MAPVNPPSPSPSPVRRGDHPAVWISLVFLTACPRQAAIGPPDAGLTDAGTDGGGRAELFQLSVRYLLADGGLTLLSSTDGGKPEIDPTRHLELSTSLGIRNYRVRIFDELDRA